MIECKELNTDAAPLYLYLGQVPEPLSIFKNTRKARAGCYVEASAGGKLEERSYWSTTERHTTEGDHRPERQAGSARKRFEIYFSSSCGARDGCKRRQEC